MAIDTTEKLYTTTEAGKFLGLAQDTVRQYVFRSIITPFTQVGPSYLIAESELLRYRRERRKPGKPPQGN